jgi:poly(3-hydroxybutyrate) depolymerase
MKRFFWILLALTFSVVAHAQPGQMPQNVILTARANNPIVYGGPTRAEGRSYNFTPVFFIYPDAKLDKDGAAKLLEELAIQPLLDSEYGTAMVINPVGDKYAAGADFEAFEKLFNASRGPGNLKVVGIGQGASFVNQVIAPKAGGQVAGILTVGGKPGRTVDPAGVPAYVAGKGAAKVAKPYQTAVAAHADEPLLKVVVNPDDKAAAKDVFADAWKQVLGRNYRFNNYKHTHYEGAKLGEYGSYELEPYLDCESLGIKRIIVEQPMGQRGPQGQDVPKQLWYEYWPEELLEGAPEKSVPVMVLLHGNQNDPRTQAETSGFIQLAGEKRFFVVEMEWQGTPNYQAMGHDGIESVLYQLLAKYPQLDPSRVYAEGLSAGSITATALGIKKSHLFTAVGGHSGGIFGGPFKGYTSVDILWAEATQKRGAVEMPYCSVFGTADNVVPYIKPDNWKGNNYLNAWNAYEQMNGMEVVDRIDFSIDPVFGQPMRDRETIVTNKGDGITIETGVLYKGDIPMVKMVAVMDYGHWNFMPTARIMWDFFMHYRRDPETKKLIYNPW